MRQKETTIKAANASRLEAGQHSTEKGSDRVAQQAQSSHHCKKGNSAEKRLQRSSEISASISQAKEKAETLRGEIDGLKQEVEAANELLQMEKLNARKRSRWRLFGAHGSW